MSTSLVFPSRYTTFQKLAETEMAVTSNCSRHRTPAGRRRQTAERIVNAARRAAPPLLVSATIPIPARKGTVGQASMTACVADCSVLSTYTFPTVNFWRA